MIFLIYANIRDLNLKIRQEPGFCCFCNREFENKCVNVDVLFGNIDTFELEIIIIIIL